jgi:hypothetical protein
MLANPLVEIVFFPEVRVKHVEWVVQVKDSGKILVFVLMVKQPVIEVVNINVCDWVSRGISAICDQRVSEQRVLQTVLKQKIFHGFLVAKDNA